MTALGLEDTAASEELYSYVLNARENADRVVTPEAIDRVVEATARVSIDEVRKSMLETIYLFYEKSMSGKTYKEFIQKAPGSLNEFKEALQAEIKCDPSEA